MAQWFEDDGFWDQLYPFMFSARAFERAPQQVEDIIRLTGIESGSVLDLCSGPGRHTLEWAKRGFRVTGVDRTESLMNIAKERASKQGVEIEWVLEDMRFFQRPCSFDLVQSMFTSFGYFEEKGEDRAVLAQIYENLKPGGMLIMDVVGKEVLARNFHDSGTSPLDDGSILVERRKIVDAWSRIENEWIVIRNGATQTFRFCLNLYSAQELKLLFESVGFHTIRIFGGLSGAPYDIDASRLIVLGSKP